MFVRKEIGDVFTPRSSNVNPKMYIEREHLEKGLKRSVNGSMHSFPSGRVERANLGYIKKFLKKIVLIMSLLTVQVLLLRNP